METKEEIQIIPYEDIEDAMEKIVPGKYPGIDEKTPEIIKYSGRTAPPRNNITRRFRKIIRKNIQQKNKRANRTNNGRNTMRVQKTKEDTGLNFKRTNCMLHRSEKSISSTEKRRNLKQSK